MWGLGTREVHVKTFYFVVICEVVDFENLTRWVVSNGGVEEDVQTDALY